MPKQAEAKGDGVINPKDFNFNQVVTKKYEKRLLLVCIHHFDSDVINNMDQMRISEVQIAGMAGWVPFWFKAPRF